MDGFDLLTALRNGCFGLNSDPDNLIPKSARTTALVAGVYTWPEQHPGLQDWQGGKLADPMNLHVWRTKNLDRGGYGSWFAAVPAQTTATPPPGRRQPISGRGPGGGKGGKGRGGGAPSGIIPMEFEGKISPDHKIERAIFSKNYGGKLPVKVDGIASASAGHAKRDIFFITSGGPIVSHHAGNQPNQYDRFVYEIQGDELHPTKKGGFSTFTIVKWQHPGCAGGKAHLASVALNFTGDTGPGWGLAAFMTKKVGGAAPQTTQPVTTSGPKGAAPPRKGRKPGQFKESGKAISVLAYLSQEKKGPLFPGHPTSDQHRYPGVNKDGEALNAAHNHTNTFFSNGSVIFDAPIAFRPVFWPNPGTSLIPTQCYIEFDPAATHPGVCGKVGKGLWKIWTENPDWIVDPNWPEKEPKYPEDGPPPWSPVYLPYKIQPTEDASPSDVGKAPVRGESTTGLKRKGPVSGDSKYDKVPQGEEKLYEYTGMTGKMWYEAPDAFHAFAASKIETTPDWSKEVPYAHVFTNKGIYVRGETLSRPERYIRSTADGGKIFAPAEVNLSTARFEDIVQTNRSNAYFGVWGTESSGGSSRIDFGFMSEDRSNCYVRGASLLLGSDSEGISEQLLLRFRDDEGAITTNKKFEIGGSIVAKSSIKSDSPIAGIGYAAGAGGVVTQVTSKTTGVTLNKITGQITMNGSALNGGQEVSFVVTNSAVATTDAVFVNHSSGGTGGAYIVQAHSIGAGSFSILVGNVSAGAPKSEAIVLTFAIIRGVIA